MFVSFIKNKLSIGAWVYLWTFYFVPLVYILIFVPLLFQRILGEYLSFYFGLTSFCTIGFKHSKTCPQIMFRKMQDFLEIHFLKRCFCGQISSGTGTRPSSLRRVTVYIRQLEVFEKCINTEENTTESCNLIWARL